jgi:hypothetical protein
VNHDTCAKHRGDQTRDSGYLCNSREEQQCTRPAVSCFSWSVRASRSRIKLAARQHTNQLSTNVLRSNTRTSCGLRLTAERAQESAVVLTLKPCFGAGDATAGSCGRSHTQTDKFMSVSTIHPPSQQAPRLHADDHTNHNAVVHNMKGPAANDQLEVSAKSVAAYTESGGGGGTDTAQPETPSRRDPLLYPSSE